MNLWNLRIKLRHVFDTVFHFSYIETVLDECHKINRIKDKN